MGQLPHSFLGSSQIILPGLTGLIALLAGGQVFSCKAVSVCERGLMPPPVGLVTAPFDKPPTWEFEKAPFLTD